MAKKGTYKVSADNAEILAKKVNPNLILVKDTYRGMMNKCTWFEKGISEPFTCRPQSIIRGLTTGHPKLSKEKRELTTFKRHGVKNIFEKKEYIKQCTFKKHGVDNIFKNKKFIEECTYAKHKVKNIFENKQYIKECVMKKYGVGSTNQVKEIQDKIAKKSNLRRDLIHWKTGEILTCIASYEYNTVLFLNKNQINYIWQPSPIEIKENVTYRPDIYLIDEDKYIEIKGYCRSDFLKKWELFIKLYPNSELWMEQTLIDKGIL